MELTTNAFTIVTFILSIVSSTLAIAAFIFSWKSFNKSSELQMKAQNILSKVSEKVDVVVERTSHQIDKAWDYITSSPLPLPTEQIPNEAEDKKEELREKLLKEVRQEATEVMKKSGIDPDKLKDLRLKVEALIKKTTERTESMVEKNMLLTSLSNLELVANSLAKLHGMQIDKKTTLPDIANFLGDKIAPKAYEDLLDIFTLADKKVNIETLSDSKIDSNLNMSKMLARYLLHVVTRFKS